MVARIAVGGAAKIERTDNQDSGPAQLSLTMAKDSHTLQWRIDVMTVLHRVTAAEQRLSASMRVNKTTMLAAADELEAATKDATLWVTANPCPEARMRAQVAWVLNSCAEAARAARHAVNDPSTYNEETIVRIRGLLAAAEYHTWRLQPG